MARYSTKPENDLYDQLSYLYEESGLNLSEFVRIILRVIADLIENEGSRL